MKKNGELYCDECNLAIMQQQHRTIAREPSSGKPATVLHFHSRDDTDCWRKAIRRAQELSTSLNGQQSFDFALVKGVIH